MDRKPEAICEIQNLACRMSGMLQLKLVKMEIHNNTLAHEARVVKKLIDMGDVRSDCMCRLIFCTANELVDWVALHGSHQECNANISNVMALII